MGDGYTFPWPKKKTPGLHGGAMERSEGGTVASTSSEVIPEQGSALERRDGCASQSEGRKREREETFISFLFPSSPLPFYLPLGGVEREREGRREKKLCLLPPPPLFRLLFPPQPLQGKDVVVAGSCSGLVFGSAKVFRQSRDCGEKKPPTGVTMVFFSPGRLP